MIDRYARQLGCIPKLSSSLNMKRCNQKTNKPAHSRLLQKKVVVIELKSRSCEKAIGSLAQQDQINPPPNIAIGYSIREAVPQFVLLGQYFRLGL